MTTKNIVVLGELTTEPEIIPVIMRFKVSKIFVMDFPLVHKIVPGNHGTVCKSLCCDS